MQTTRLSADDPRLTAYALGELEAAEIPMVEAALRTDPALHNEVEQIRACAAAVESALAAEPAPEQATPFRIPSARRLEHPRRRWLAFPQLYYVCGGLAAACLAVFVAVNRDEITERERRRTERRRTPQEQTVPGSAIMAVDLAPDSTENNPPSADPIPAGRADMLLSPRYGETAFAALRQHLAARRLPPPEAVRPAALVNAFRYQRPPAPAVDAPPIAADLEVGEAPWAVERKLVKIGLLSRKADLTETRQAIIDGLTQSQASIAKNVRIQVEFNPALVAGYRLVGVEGDTATRATPVDELASAPEMLAGQAFTVLYEIVPPPPAGTILSPTRSVLEVPPAELLTVRLHYVEPTDGSQRTLEFSLADRGRQPAAESTDFQLATAAAEFALRLRDPHSPGSSRALQAVRNRAASAAADPAHDPDGRRTEFVELVKQAQLLLE